MIEAQFSATANKTNTELLPYVVIEYLNLKRERGASRASGRFFADNSIKLRVVRKYISLQRKKILRQNVKIARIDFSDTMQIKIIIKKEDDSGDVSSLSSPLFHAFDTIPKDTICTITLKNMP